MKNFFKFLGIIALVAVIGFSFTACGEEEDDTGGGSGGSGATDPKAGLYGTWVRWAGVGIYPYFLTITADTIRWSYGSDFIQYTNVQWTAAANNNNSYKTEYPNGYTFTGTKTREGLSMYSDTDTNLGFVALSPYGHSVYLGKTDSSMFSTGSGSSGAVLYGGPIFAK